MSFLERFSKMQKPFFHNGFFLFHEPHYINFFFCKFLLFHLSEGATLKRNDVVISYLDIHTFPNYNKTSFSLKLLVYYTKNNKNSNWNEMTKKTKSLGWGADISLSLRRFKPTEGIIYADQAVSLLTCPMIQQSNNVM